MGSHEAVRVLFRSQLLRTGHGTRVILIAFALFVLVGTKLTVAYLEKQHR